MIDFPLSLPAVLRNAFSAREVSHIRANEVESGPPLFELLTADTPLLASVSWSLSGLQFRIFEAWFKYRCEFGAESFGLGLPVGAGYLLHECYFADGGYTHTYNGKRVNVSAQILALKKIYDDEDDAELLLALDEVFGLGEDFFSVINSFNEFAEIYLPDNWGDLEYGGLA